jgi:hypothetical protein
MRIHTLLVAALGAAALATPVAAQAHGYVTAGTMSQWAAPYPVARHDQTFTLQPNATQTFTMAIPELGAGHHFQVPCWGYDLVGPGLDQAAAGLLGFGWIGDATTNFRGDRPDGAFQDAAGNWILPDSNAVIGSSEGLQGRSCRAIGWDFYVDPKIDGADSAVARAARKARRTHHAILVRPKHKARTKRANIINDGSVQVTLAGMRYRTAGDPAAGEEMVVTLTAGNLAGPTTLTTHARVLLQP